MQKSVYRSWLTPHWLALPQVCQVNTLKTTLKLACKSLPTGYISGFNPFFCNSIFTHSWGQPHHSDVFPEHLRGEAQRDAGQVLRHWGKFFTAAELQFSGSTLLQEIFLTRVNFKCVFLRLNALSILRKYIP